MFLPQKKQHRKLLIASLSILCVKFGPSVGFLSEYFNYWDTHNPKLYDKQICLYVPTKKWVRKFKIAEKCHFLSISRKVSSR